MLGKQVGGGSSADKGEEPPIRHLSSIPNCPIIVSSEVCLVNFQSKYPAAPPGGGGAGHLSASSSLTHLHHSQQISSHKYIYVYQTTRMPYSCTSVLLCPPLRHKKSGSLLFLLYFSNLVKWISPKLQTVFLTTQLRYFLK